MHFLDREKECKCTEEPEDSDHERKPSCSFHARRALQEVGQSSSVL